MTDLEQAYNERLKELEAENAGLRTALAVLHEGCISPGDYRRLGAENKRLRAPWLCDCHTWPGPDEMHAYVEALEKRLHAKANS